MSAIWGCIDFSEKFIDNVVIERMKMCLSKYKIDEIREYTESNVYMGCGIQYITKESYKEKLPFKKDGFIFTADCIIDNREKLISDLKLDYDIPDGDILYYAWKKWGGKMGEHVVGMFSFAVYDEKIKKFYLYTDHIASRCIYYCVKGGKIFFSTLTSSIVDSIGKHEINDQWMFESIATDFSYSYLTEGLTPYKDIYIIPYGTGIEIDSSMKINKKRYWDPLKTIHQKKRFDDDSCRKVFLRTFLQCVKDSIRTDGEVGILLSSGLDSTAVASVAAKQLKKKKKKLYSYTSVPLREYMESLEKKDGYFIDDESEGVNKFCEHYSNIEPSFIECRGRSVWTDIEDWVDYLEFPTKAGLNSVWIVEAYREARKKDVKVFLSGSNGNFTISYGDMMSSLRRELLKGNIKAFYKQFMTYTEKEHLYRKKYLIYFIKNMFYKYNFKKEFFDTECVKEEGLNNNNFNTWKKMVNGCGGRMKSQSEYRKSLMLPYIFQLCGILDTKKGLYHGIIIRDPTLDKRMIELCLALPYQAFAWNGVERRLVREYLKEYVPDEIRMITRHRGRQSGDAVVRLNMFGNNEMRKLCASMSDRMSRYFYIDKVKSLLERETNKENFLRKVKIVSCICFMGKEK